jgi:hypothetical protein
LPSPRGPSIRRKSILARSSGDVEAPSSPLSLSGNHGAPSPGSGSSDTPSADSPSTGRAFRPCKSSDSYV